MSGDKYLYSARQLAELEAAGKPFPENFKMWRGNVQYRGGSSRDQLPSIPDGTPVVIIPSDTLRELFRRLRLADYIQSA